MVDRTVKVSLTAQVSGYVQGMEQAARKTRDVGTEAEKLVAKRQAMEDLGRPLLAFGVLAAAAVAIAVKKFADFDQAMSNVKAVTQESAENMGLLRDAALEAGGRTIYTATEAANAIEELGKAGIKTADILGGALDGALDLASSGQLEVARAAEITATTLQQFGLAGDRASHVADVLSAGAGKALGSVEDLSEGLKYVGPVAASMGVSLEETAGALALFADQGLVGEQAGTSLRGVLSSLTSPSSQAADEIKRLGINLYDSNGKFLGLQNVAGKLSDAYKGLDDRSRDASLGIIFGNQQVTAARVLFDKGAQGIAKYTAEVNDSGYASRVAADRLDNLSGDVEKLGGAFDTALIKSGSGANDVLRKMTQDLTGLIDGFSNLPGPVQQVALGLVVVAAGTALVGGGLLTVIPKIAAYRAAMVTLAAEGSAVAGAMRGLGSFLMGPWGLALAAATLGVQLLGGYLEGLRASSKEMTASLTAASSAADILATASKGMEATAWKDVNKDLKDLNNVLDAAKDQTDNLFARFDSTHFGAFDALRKIGTQLGAMAENDLPDAQKAFSLLAKETDGSDKHLWTLLDTMSDYKSALVVQATATGDYSETMTDAEKKQVLLNYAMGDAKTEANRVADGYIGAADSAQQLTNQVTDLLDAMMRANGINLDASDAAIKYEDSLRVLAERAKDAAAGLDIGTDAGARNRAAFDDVARAAQASADANLAAGASAEQIQAQLQASHDKLVEQALGFGLSQAAAEDLADAVLHVPTLIEINAIADVADAMANIRALQTLAAQKIPGLHIPAGTVLTGAGHAAGGIVAGAPSRKDNILLPMATGEFVMDAPTTAKPANRAVLEYMHDGGDITKWVAAPTYVSAPAVSGGGGGSSTKLEMYMYGTDPATAGEIAAQRLMSKLVR